MDRDWKTITLYTLAGLTAIDLLLWFFKQQTALFLALFVLIPLWAVWVWKYIPNVEDEILNHEEGKEENHP